MALCMFSSSRTFLLLQTYFGGSYTDNYTSTSCKLYVHHYYFIAFSFGSTVYLTEYRPALYCTIISYL